MRYARVIFALNVLLIVLCMPSSIVAQGNTLFTKLKKQYLSLRNTDPQLSKIKDWEKIAKEFQVAVKRYPRNKHAASALYNASIVYEQLYEKKRTEVHFELCTKLLARIVKEYPSDSLVDDALLRKGDFLLYRGGSTVEARKSYQKIIESYPDSDMYDVAVVRMNTLDEGAYRKDLNSDLQDLVSKSDSQQPVIVLDPGHGGEDLGAVGPAQLLEKDVVLAIAFELEHLLKEKLGALVKLTRRRDEFVPLAERTQIANNFNADLFLSLHVNASVNKNMSGFEIYYLDNARDKSSRKLAERENASVDFEDDNADLRYMISDLIQHGKRDDSIVLANSLLGAMSDYMSGRWDNVVNLGLKRAPFYVLVGAHMPCLLVEMFFIDHARDGVRLAQKAFRKDLAQALFNGVKDFLEKREVSKFAS